MQTVWLLTGRAICLWLLEATSSSITQEQERCINLLRPGYEPLLPLAWLFQLLWLLTARAICLWRIAATDTTLSSAPPFISLLHPGCEAVASGSGQVSVMPAGPAFE